MGIYPVAGGECSTSPVAQGYFAADKASLWSSANRPSSILSDHEAGGRQVLRPCSTMVSERVYALTAVKFCRVDLLINSAILMKVRNPAIFEDQFARDLRECNTLRAKTLTVNLVHKKLVFNCKPFCSKILMTGPGKIFLCADFPHCVVLVVSTQARDSTSPRDVPFAGRLQFLLAPPSIAHTFPLQAHPQVAPRIQATKLLGNRVHQRDRVHARQRCQRVPGWNPTAVSCLDNMGVAGHQEPGGSRWALWL